MPSTSPPILLIITLAIAGVVPPQQVGSRSGARDEATRDVAAEARPTAQPPRLLYPGYGAFAINAPPRLPRQLAKPLLHDGELEPGYFILHFRSPITSEDEAWLDSAARIDRGSASARVRWPIPHDALGVWVDGATDWLALWRWKRSDWVGRYQPAYKLDPALVLDEAADAPLLLDADPVPGHPRELLVAEIEAIGARVLEPVLALEPLAGDPCPLVVEAAPSLLTRLAWIEGIRSLQEHVEREPLSSDSTTGSARIRTVQSILLGPGGSSTNLVAPVTTLTLGVSSGTNPSRGALSTSDVGLLRSSDNNRLAARKREQLTLAFDRTVPADATLLAIRVLVEHHELSKVNPGDVLWKLGHGSLASPVIVESTSAPYRAGPNQEGLDLWTPTTLVPDPNALELVLQNNSADDDALLDQVHVEVDFVVPDSPPRIMSTPSLGGAVAQAYGYDADRRADAIGTAPILWSVASGPLGFSIDAASGLVSWTPGSTGSFAITLRATNDLGTATQQFAVQVAAAAPLPATLLPSSASIAYCPPERLAFGPAASQERLNVFLPPGVPPTGGWPVVLTNRAGGGLAFAPLSSISSTGGTAPLHAFVSNRIAVVDFGVTGIGNGQGLFYPPGHPSGRYESFRSLDDNPEKEAEWAIQWLKTQGSLPLDATKICLRGSSQGAIIAIWAAMGPERARLAGSPQVRASTRVKAVLALQPPTSVWAFDQSPNLASQMIAHFEQASAPGVPASALSQVAESLQKDGSIMRFAFDSAAARTNNETQAICLVFNEPVKLVGGVPADMTLDATGFPRLRSTLAQPFVHDSWAGYVFYKRLLDLSASSSSFHGLNSVFAVRDTSALAPPFAYHTRTYAGTINGSQANAIAHDWVLRTLGAN